MDILNLLLKITSDKFIKTDEPMSKHTSFKIGGNADFLVTPANMDEAAKIIYLAKEKNIPLFIMGNGSNLLVSDKGIRGIVLKTANLLNDIDILDDDVLYVESGVILSKAASVAASASLTGFEELSGIPGTIGGGVYMNAGAYGKEFKDILVESTYLTSDGDIKTISSSEHDFSYRHSIFLNNDGFIMSSKLKLNKGDLAQIKEKMAEITKRRKDKQPLELPSAGSTFKRPQGDYASRLIEEAGLKGLNINGAEVSTKHSGFVVNRGGATCSDVIELTNKVIEIVKDKFNINLELEVKLVGEF